MIHSLLYMFFGSILIGFYVSSSLLVDQMSHIRSSMSKFYTAVWMALWMVVLELIMFDYSVNYYLIIGLLLVLVFFLARRQVLVNDRQYLEAMIQHHSSAILTSKEILKKTDDQQITELAEQIIASQESEIQQMENLLFK